MPGTEDRTDLDARYGRSRLGGARTRAIAIAAAVALAVAIAAWVTWGGLLTGAARIEVRDIGNTITSDSEVLVEFELSVAPGTGAACALQALSPSFTIVGWRIVDIPASEDRTRVFAEKVRTAEPATVGLIYRCWLT